MNVIVLAKYVPNPNGTPDIGDDHLLKREGVEGAMDPGDEVGVEQGLQLTEQLGGEVTLVSMGPEPAVAGLRKGLSMGAHKAVVITDPALRGADALATARVLAAAIHRGPFDIVLAGVESTDGYTGTVPMTLAELLGVPSATFARHVEVSDGELTIQRQTEAGYDVVQAPLPAVVTLTAGATNPRYPTLKGIMQAKQKPVDRLTLSDLGLSAEDVRPSQSVTGIRAAAAKAAGEVIEDDGSAPARIARFLQEAKVI
jgi:electron transfer flavoprotein beta subunit